MQITVSSPCCTTPFEGVVDNSLVTIGRSLAGGHIPSIAKAIVSHSYLKEEILFKVMNPVNEECAAICKRTDKFSWEDCISEPQSTYPTLLRVHRSVVSYSDNRNVHKQSSSPGLCMAILVILKERNRDMCGVQTFLSLVLFNSHMQNKVCQQSLSVFVCVCWEYIKQCTVHTAHRLVTPKANY